MTRITRHLRGGEHVTIIRDPGEPMPAWLGGGCPERTVPPYSTRLIHWEPMPMFSMSLPNGEDIALPPLEDQA